MESPRLGMVDVQVQISQRLLEGATLDEIEEEIIDPSPFRDEQKSALWLFAWLSMSRDQFEREATTQAVLLEIEDRLVGERDRDGSF